YHPGKANVVADALSRKSGMIVGIKVEEEIIRDLERFSPNKSSVVHEKPNTPRSCLRWKSTGRIFKTVGLRWIPTRKMFFDCTTKVDSEPLNGSNDDITNPYECDQTLNVSACTLNLGLVPQPPSSTPNLPCPLFAEYFNPPPCAVSPVPAAVAAPRAVDPEGSPSSTTIDQNVPSASTSPTIQEIQSQVTHQDLSFEETTLQGFIHVHQNA
nr:hypothetical protein [Tanacetum cinerariifolium]